MATSRKTKKASLRTKKNNRTFFTIGYQGLTPSKLTELLKRNHVRLLVDIRQTAWSRKRGFSKTKLSLLLVRNGIEYSHESNLGTPKNIRDHYKKTKDLNGALGKFRVFLRKNSSSLQKLKNAVNGHALCFMCVENEPNECHRSIVADEFQKLTGWNPVHL